MANELFQGYVPPTGPAPKSDTPAAVPPQLPGMPSPKQQQWGVVISIVIIVLMIVVGAFYAWGKRIAQERELLAPMSAE